MKKVAAEDAFGETLATYCHQSESKTAAVSWTKKSTFTIMRLHSDIGLSGTLHPISEECAIHVSIIIKPAPLSSYDNA